MKRVARVTRSCACHPRAAPSSHAAVLQRRHARRGCTAHTHTGFTRTPRPARCLPSRGSPPTTATATTRATMWSVRPPTERAFLSFSRTPSKTTFRGFWAPAANHIEPGGGKESCVYITLARSILTPKEVAKLHKCGFGWVLWARPSRRVRRNAQTRAHACACA